ncbi:ZBED8 protein, partial [Crocuta crocuta]
TLPKCGCASTQKLCFHASLKAAYNVLKEKNPYTTVKPHVLEDIQETSNLDQRRKIETVSLSNKFIHSIITSISFNPLLKVKEELAYKPFPLTTVTDVFQCIQFLVFVHKVHSDTVREFLFGESLWKSQRALTSSNLLKVLFCQIRVCL